MLKKIFIQNFALIDQLEVDLEKGLQVITGETGTGKSIILNALKLILGQRVDAKSINNVDKKSVIEVDFLLDKHQYLDFFEENDLDFETQTVIRREILPSGKSRAFINDVPVTLETLKELTTRLVDIHSQFETSNLFNDEYQFKIVDGLSENKRLIAEYQKRFKAFQSLNFTLQKLKQKLTEDNKESDYKNFLLEELNELDLETLDLENLQNQVFLQENAETISENLSDALRKLQQEDLGILISLNEMKNKLQKSGNVSPSLEEIGKRLDQVYYEIKDIEGSLEAELEKIEINPEHLNLLLSKINQLNTIFLKHQVNTLGELIKIKTQLTHEQSSFGDLENQIIQLENQITKEEKELNFLAETLSKNRKQTIPTFEENMEDLLENLGLEKAKIEVRLDAGSQLNIFGKETIQLLFQANAGFELKPIQAAISGGERSRIMLAIKKIMAENSALPTLILDEIDTGISGKIANEMGKVMQSMSNNLQLIVITHLAQIAAKGNNNYKVIKEDFNGKTKSNIIPLNENEKLTEIAQLLSGKEITEAALQQAKELISN